MTAPHQPSHSPVCVQWNTGIPSEFQKCICGNSRPTYELDGPFSTSRTRQLRVWLRTFLITLATVWAFCFITGALLRHYGVL